MTNLSARSEAITQAKEFLANNPVYLDTETTGVGENDTIIEPGDMLVFVAGHAPIQGTQSLYFRDPIFLERSKTPALPPSGSFGRTRRPQPFLLRDGLDTDKNRK